MAPPLVFVLSPFILAELARVLRYARMRLLHKLDDAQLDAYVHSLQTAALIVNPPAATTTQVMSADPEENGQGRTPQRDRVVNEAAGTESVERRETGGRAKRRGQETRAEHGKRIEIRSCMLFAK